MKKTLLIFCGILIALISLEILLQTTSFIVLHINKLNINKTIKLAKNKNAITILCIGESTTRAQYPNLLSKYLNSETLRKGTEPKSFIVIDCGISGTTIENILKSLDADIERYKPDIVISMMGINDAYMKDTVIYNKKYNLKILELLRLIKKHIYNLPDNLYAENLYVDIENLTIEYVKSGKEPVILQEMLNNNNNKSYHSEILRALVYLYRAMDDLPKAEKYADLYMHNYFANPDTFVPFALTDIYIRQKKYKTAKDLIFKIITDKNLTESFIDDYMCKVIESYIKFMPSDKFIELYNMLTENKVQTKIMDNLYAYLKKHNPDIKKYKYHNKFKNFILVPYFNTVKIKEGYHLFAEKIIKKNIIYICMSYPTMPIETFKDFFKNSKYEDKIIFVSNEYNFKEKLKTLPFFDLFVDNFGGSFGHCTDEGNMLIAENVGTKILEIVN